MDVEALQRRVASSRDNWIVREGDIVTHYDTDKAFRVVRVYPFLGDAWDVGSNEIDVTPLYESDEDVEHDEDAERDEDAESDADAVPRTTAEVFFSHDHDNPDPERASFCECCFVHFDDAFVQWTFHDGAPSRFLCGYPVPRGGGLEFQHSRCKRCAARYPHGRLLWDFVRRAVRRRTIAMYWNSLAHTPKYVNRVTAEAAADVGGCFRA